MIIALLLLVMALLLSLLLNPDHYSEVEVESCYEKKVHLLRNTFLIGVANNSGTNLLQDHLSKSVNDLLYYHQY